MDNAVEVMRAGPACHALNHPYEACKLLAYPDPASPLFNMPAIPTSFAKLSGAPWTIGWGGTQEVRVGQVITQSEADVRYARQLARDFEPPARSGACAGVAVPVGRHHFDGLQHGPGGRGRDGILYLAEGRPSTFLRKLNAGDYAGATNELLKWVRAGGQVLKGLQRRRHATRLLLLGWPVRKVIEAGEAAFH